MQDPDPTPIWRTLCGPDGEPLDGVASVSKCPGKGYIFPQGRRTLVQCDSLYHALRPQSTLRLRPGDQRLPTPNDNPVIHDLVIEDIKSRLALGISRYGTGLQAHNGRDCLQDAYDEALDLCTYLRQTIFERDGK